MLKIGDKVCLNDKGKKSFEYLNLNTLDVSKINGAEIVDINEDILGSSGQMIPIAHLKLTDGTFLEVLLEFLQERMKYLVFHTRGRVLRSTPHDHTHSIIETDVPLELDKLELIAMKLGTNVQITGWVKL